jgi:hypothetical protein
VVTLGEGETDPEAVAEDSGLEEAAGVAEAVALTDAWGEAATAGVDVVAGEAATAGDVDGFGKAAALRTSLSRTPTLRSLLCLAVSTVRSKVSPKKIHPKYTVALVRTVAV